MGADAPVPGPLTRRRRRQRARRPDLRRARRLARDPRRPAPNPRPAGVLRSALE